MNVTEERLSLRDAADILGISEVTARRWVKSGKLKAYQPGRKYLIPASAVEELLGEEEAPKAAPSLERSFNDVLKEEQLGEWQQAVDDVRRFREDAKDRLEDALSAWRAVKDEGSSEQERKKHRDEMAWILNEASNAEAALMASVVEGLDNMGTLPPRGPAAELAPNAYLEEIQQASRLYGELVGMVKGAGLSVGQVKRDEASSASHRLDVLEPAV